MERKNEPGAKRRTVLAGGLGAAVATMAAGRAAASPASANRKKKSHYVRKKLRKMSLEEKVGQVFVHYAYGATADTADPADVSRNQDLHGVDNAAQLIARYRLGGIIYFAWSDNVADPEQILGLSNGLQDASLRLDRGVPLLVSTDQEHGIVTRVGPPATQLPGAMALGATHDADDAEDAAAVSGKELRAMGINQDFAPVADVNVNPDNPVIGIRSFSSDPGLAADLTAAQVRGYESRGDLASAAKHFPGHGDTDVDSHYGLPEITHTYEEWTELDKPPFEAAVSEGIKAVMTAHIQFPALDDTLKPATLSHPILTGLLREELGYDGVIVTDSLGMEGVRELYGDAEVPVMALEAGADLLLMPPDLELAFGAVLDAVAAGRLTEERVERSVERILGLKWDLGLAENPYADPSRLWDVVGTEEHRSEAVEIHERTTTLLENDGTLPFESTGSALVTGWGVTTTATIGAEVEGHGWEAEVVATGAAPTPEEIDAAVAAAEGKDAAIVTTYNVDADSSQLTLIARLRETGVKVVTVAARNPYDIAHLTGDVNASLATYGYGAEALAAAVAAAFGENDPSGRLPVDVPSAEDPSVPLYRIGHGLSYE
ncbi:glycoside hydrolase family 3 protein [Salininema proteolyticum]|uniref:beta-N-acetylhexosaminidase n=1 Tax=Salininema proteolyticum TaxID=1607685 RepID=A0ABV8U5R4_9ACTN